MTGLIVLHNGVVKLKNRKVDSVTTKTLLMRQVAVDARGKNNRAEQFHVVTTILDASIDGGQVGELYERRWDGEVDIRSLKSAMQMDVLRCQTPEMVRKEIWAHLLAYNLLRTVMAVAAAENGIAAVPGQDHSGGPRDVRRLAGGAT